MRYSTVLEARLKAANPVPDPAAPPAGAWSADHALLEVERRRGVIQTIDLRSGAGQAERSAGFARRPQPRVAAAIAGLATAVAVIAVTVMVMNGTGDDAAGGTATDRTPLETAVLYYQRFEAGDHRGALDLFAPDAIFTWTELQIGSSHQHGPVSGSSAPVFQSDAYSVPHNVRSQADWDGDGEITSADSRAGFIVNLSAAGIEMRAECTADGEVVTCVQDPISAFISDDSRLMDGTVTFTVRDGLIVHDAYLISYADVSLERTLQGEYEMWVREHHPDVADGLFVLNVGLPGHLLTSPDTAAIHRTLIVEWRQATSG